MRQILENTVKTYPDKPALIFKGEEISFSQLYDNAAKLAQVLQAKGVLKGDKVAIHLPNSPQFAYSYLACFFLGAVGVPLDFMLKGDELQSCLDHSETKILLTQSKKDIDFNQLKNDVRSLTEVLFFGEEQGLDAQMIAVSTELPSIAIAETDPALIMYTSGTTGKPKGILLNHKHLQGSPEAMKHFVDLTDKDIKLAAIPLSHIGGFVYLQNCIHFGITVVLMARFNPFEFLENITRYKITCFHIVPPMYNAILTLKQIDKFDLSSLRWVVVFGAPSSPEILKRFHQYCPNAKLLNGWGMTETCPPNTVTPMNSDNIASVGKPAPHCEIKIFGDNDSELSSNEIGEIVIRGWVIMQEYYKDPESTAQTIRDGWLRTGDLGRFDDQGFLYIVGRKKEMIKVGGQIVYAPEVEAALYKHEDISEVAVIGVEDKMKGEALKACVVLKEGSQLTSEDVRYFAREHLANFKVPQTVEIYPELPKNRTGKIDKEQLKKETLIQKA